MPKTNKDKPMKPIPTVVKERLGETELRNEIEQKIKQLSGQEILAVTVSGADSVAIVREDYLYEIINLCNTLLYDKMEQELSPAPSKSHREEILAEGKQAIKKLLASK